jgi:hypothetical protein
LWDQEPILCTYDHEFLVMGWLGACVD